MLQIPRPRITQHFNVNFSFAALFWGCVILGILSSGCATSTGHSPRQTERGIASWYGPGFHGNLTANGERYDMHGMTAAHKTLPMGSRVRVVSLETGKSVDVRINDRGPFIHGRIIDLSREAARQLGMLSSGTEQVEIRVLSPPRPNSGTFDYWVQLGSFSQKRRAEQFSASLPVPTQRIRIVQARPSGKRWFRVQTGPFTSLGEADRIAQTLKADLALQPFVVKIHSH